MENGMESRYDVIPAAEQWQLRHGGEIVSEHEWQDDAIEAGRAAARANVPSELVIHGTDGQIQAESTFEDSEDMA